MVRAEGCRELGLRQREFNTPREWYGFGCWSITRASNLIERQLSRDTFAKERTDSTLTSFPTYAVAK